MTHSLRLDGQLRTILQDVGLPGNLVEAMTWLVVITTTISKVDAIGLSIDDKGDAYLTLHTTDPFYKSLTWYGRARGWVAEMRNPTIPGERVSEPVQVSFIGTHLIAHFG